MKEQRLTEILNNHNICDVFYEEKPVWIQEVTGNIARVGFIDGTSERDVLIEDLYEDML